MLSAKEIDEAIDASINNVIADSSEHVQCSRLCTENDINLFVDKLRLATSIMISKYGEDNYFYSGQMTLKSNELELFIASTSSVEASKAKKCSPKSLSKLWCTNEHLA